MAFPTKPKASNVPTVTYEYVDGDDHTAAHHHARCRCKWDIRVTDPLACRRAVHSHVGAHLSRMIFDPEPDIDI
jgi:hypothetical protein